MSEATRGPWKVCEADEGEAHQFEIVGHEPAGLHPSDHVLANVFFVAYGDAEIRNGRANAELIAAAPDLLEALKAILDDGIGYEGDTESCECGPDGTGIGEDGNPCCHILVRRAIAKAEGR